MSEHFIQWINIEKYKCFENFEAKDFKRINLIAGKNNVGKTALMEAININTASEDIETFSYSIATKNILRNLLEIINKKFENNRYKHILEKSIYKTNSNLIDLKFKSKNENGILNFDFSINSKNFIINSNDFSYEDKRKFNNIFISRYRFTIYTLQTIYEAIQLKDKEDELNYLINKFDNNIKSFKFIGSDKPSCKLEKINDYVDLDEFGDGLKHYISIICALFACENGYLFIDEIDNGIHYSQLQKIWEIIFDISKEVNCQVFAVTHSLEMIKAYEKVIRNKNEDDISFIELGRDKDDNIKAQVLDKDMFLYEMENNHEVRGW